jgi:alpha-N-arabinofuranosidase
MKSGLLKFIGFKVFSLLFLLVPLFSGAKDKVHAKLTIDFISGGQPYDRMIFGQFIEHFHRQIYAGIFDPGSKLSDEQGFRKDVIAALREMKVPVVRWPGGCFVSSYHWLNGTGKVFILFLVLLGIIDG